MKKIALLICLFACLLGSCTSAEIEKTELDLPQSLRPVNLSSIVVDCETIYLEWKGFSETYEIYYSKTPDFVKPTTVTTKDSFYTFYNLEEETTYYFMVRGISGKEGRKDSELSEVRKASTTGSVKIPNVKASSSMEYELDPWSVTCTISLTWGDPSLTPETLTEVLAVPESGDVIHVSLMAEDCLSQRISFSDGVQTDTQYEIKLMNGTKERGKVNVKTVPGPVPSIRIESALDFDTTPISSTSVIHWTLYYVPATSLKKVEIYKKGQGIPSESLDIDDAVRSQGFITISGLETATEYSALLIDNTGLTVAFSDFETPEAPSQNYYIVKPGDNLNELLNSQAIQQDTLYLRPGEYTVSEDQTISRNRVLTSGSASSARITTQTIKVSGTISRLAFHNLTIVLQGYLLQASNVDFDITRLELKNCIVDVCSQGSSNSSILSVSGSGNTQILHNYTIENSIIFSRKNVAQNIAFHTGSGSTAKVEKVLFKNCTFSTCGRGIFSHSGTSDYPIDLTIENCTLYNISCSGNYGLVDIRLQGTENLSNRRLQIQRSIVHYGGSSYKILQFAGNTDGKYIPTSQMSITDLYYFASQEPAAGHTVYKINEFMTPFNGNPSDLWSSPADNPSMEGTSFRIKDRGMRELMSQKGIVIGDSNWENK